jgi:hypothetical protein
MANRLEQEFPRTAWRVVPPVGPRGRERDVVRRHIARGRRGRSEALRGPLHHAAGAARRALWALLAKVWGDPRSRAPALGGGLPGESRASHLTPSEA